MYYLENEPWSELWMLVITMCQCGFIMHNPCATLVRDVYNEGGYACVGAGGSMEKLISFFQFCYKSKSSLKNKVFKKKSLAGGWEKKSENVELHWLFMTSSGTCQDMLKMVWAGIILPCHWRSSLNIQSHYKNKNRMILEWMNFRMGVTHRKRTS